MSADPNATSADLLASLTRLMADWASTRTQAAVADEAAVEIDPIDLPPLYMLGLQGPARAGDLAAALHLSRPTMSKQLMRLERAQFIERRADPADRRASVIHLSTAGAAAYERLVARGIDMLEGALSDWDDAEAARFATQLARFVEALSQRTDHAVRTSADATMRPPLRPREGGNP